MIPSRLLVVTDRHGSDRPLVETVQAVLEGGARWVWFRERDLEPEARRELAADIHAIVRDVDDSWLTIGGDADLAAELGAAGVQLAGAAFGQAESRPSVIASEARQPRELQRSKTRAGLLRFARNDDGGQVGTDRETSVVEPAIASARRRLGAEAIVGLSAHSLADVRAAASAGADYVTLSPIFATVSKPGYGPILGLDALRAASETGIPVIALGGVGVAEARACLDAGAAGIAVMGELMRAEDPARATRALIDALG